jgi:hypothetical protein
VKGKGYRREAGSERSPDQQPRPDVQESDRGSFGRTSGQVTVKSTSIKLRLCKSGGRAAKAVELTSGDLRRAANPCENARRARLSGSQGPKTASEKSAEGVVVRSRNQERPRVNTCIGRTKARTGQEWSKGMRLDDDRVTETPVPRPCPASSTGEAHGSLGKGSRRRGGACVIDPAHRRASNVDARRRRSTYRTAVYGPVRTVVWEGPGRKARPYPDSVRNPAR